MKYLLVLAMLGVSLAPDVQAVEVTVKVDIRMYVGRVNAFGYIEPAVPPYAYNPEATKLTVAQMTVPSDSVMATSPAEVLERLSLGLKRLLVQYGFNPQDFWMQVSIREEAHGSFPPPEVVGRTFNVDTLAPMP